MLYGELTSPQIRRISKRKIAVLPIAALEQHGQHLPVITDTALVSEIARRAEQTLSRQVFLLPTFWIGSSHHHLGFAGTISLSSSTYIQCLVEIVECLSRAGFRRIVLLNGHGGNINPAKEALFRFNCNDENGRTKPWVVLATYWQVASRELASQKFMRTPSLSHACEYETSMMLALRTDWVKLKLARGKNSTHLSKFYSSIDDPPSRVFVSESYHRLTSTGAMGSPELATPEKGTKLFKLITDVVIEFLQDFGRWKRRF